MVMSFTEMEHINRGTHWEELVGKEVGIGNAKFELPNRCINGDARQAGERLELDICFKYHQYIDSI